MHGSSCHAINLKGNYVILVLYCTICTVPYSGLSALQCSIYSTAPVDRSFNDKSHNNTDGIIMALLYNVLYILYIHFPNKRHCLQLQTDSTATKTKYCLWNRIIYIYVKKTSSTIDCIIYPTVAAC